MGFSALAVRAWRGGGRLDEGFLDGVGAEGVRSSVLLAVCCLCACGSGGVSATTTQESTGFSASLLLRSFSSGPCRVVVSLCKLLSSPSLLMDETVASQLVAEDSSFETSSTSSFSAALGGSSASGISGDACAGSALVVVSAVVVTGA